MGRLIFLALILGIGLGHFLGPHAVPLKFLGDIYIGLMQMTVLPYILFSLIGSLGQLTDRNLKILAGKGSLTYLLFWCLTAGVSILFALTLPKISTGHFFSSSMVTAPPKLDWLSLFIPSNPFHSLSENAVPAVVIFSILFGLSVNRIKEKSAFLDQIHLVTKTLRNVNGMVVYLTPLGIFFIAAHTTGTMSLSELERLQAYYLIFGFSAFTLIFLAFPMLLASVTQLRVREILSTSWSSVVTAFVTGSVIAVIPLLIDAANTLTQKLHSKSHNEGSENYPSFILPLVYPFPNAGNAIALLFIAFSAWFMGHPLELEDALVLFSLGFFLMFGKVFLAIPLLLDLFQIPEDMFQLFLAAGVIAGRIGDALSSMHYLIFTVMLSATLMGLVKIRWERILRNLVLIMVVVSTGIVLTRHLILTLSPANDGKSTLLSRSSQVALPESDIQLYRASVNPVALLPGETRLQRIRRTGILRVGFREDGLPYSYKNLQGDIVGLDIDLMRQLAKDSGLKLVLVPYTRERLGLALAEDEFDIAVSGITITLKRASELLLSDTYLTVNMCLVVKDHRRSEFTSIDKINQLRDFRLATPSESLFEERAKLHFPNAEFVSITAIDDFFEERVTVDALVTHAESGSAWTLLYPHFKVINPLGTPDAAPLAFAIGGDDRGLKDVINTWISLQRLNGTIDSLSNFWIKGKTS